MAGKLPLLTSRATPSPAFSQVRTGISARPPVSSRMIALSSSALSPLGPGAGMQVKDAAMGTSARINSAQALSRSMPVRK